MANDSFGVVIRACIAMAWPPWGNPNNIQRENIQPGVALDPLGVSHGNLQPGNVMIDELVQNDLEHVLQPRLKVCDPDFVLS